MLKVGTLLVSLLVLLFLLLLDTTLKIVDLVKNLKSIYYYHSGSNATFNLKIFVLQTKRGLDITVELM